MKLNDFAQAAGISPDDANLLIRKNFGFIILSDKIEFPPNLEAMLKNTLNKGKEHIKELLDSCTSPITSFEPDNKSAAEKTNEPAENSVVKEESDSESEEEDTLKGSRKNTENYLRRLISNGYVIMFDTCSFLEASFKKFIEIAEPIFRKCNAHFSVPYVVYKEIKSKAGKKKISLIHQLINDKIIILFGEKSDWPNPNNPPFADPIFIERSLQLRRNNISTLIITQDKKLTHDICNNNNIKSVNSKALIETRKLDKDTGYLVKYQ